MAIHTPSMRVVVDQRPVTIARVLPPRFGGLDIGRPFEIALALSLLTLSRYDVGTVSGLAAETLRLSSPNPRRSGAPCNRSFGSPRCR